MPTTEEKILDAALKIFARRGYDAATTRIIAEESGFTEMTLFRKFGNKKNLFNQVMNRGNEQIEKELPQLFFTRDVEDSKEFLKSFVEILDEFISKNFEYFHLTVIEDTGIPLIERTMDQVSRYFSEVFPNKKKLNYTSFGYSMSTYVYSLNVNRYNGRSASFRDYNQGLDDLVNILHCMLEEKQNLING